jgi:hypothetical protein
MKADNNKLANGMNIWKGNGTTLLFSLKGLEISIKKEVNTIVMKLFVSTFLHKSVPANK